MQSKVLLAKSTGKLCYVTTIYRTDMLLTSTTASKPLSEQMTEPSTDDIYEALIATNAEIAGNIPPKKRKRK